MQFLEAEGYKVKDVGAVESYDLDATRGDHHLYVEVKGTVSGGDKVILTRNEVALHRKHFPHNMLAIVSNIELDRNGSMPVATGGTLRVVSPWDIDESRLEPLSYDYKVPGEETKLR